MQHTTDFLIRKDQLTTTTLRTTPAVALPEGQVRVAIHCFALTSNNITYAAFGDAMNYWQFFPVLANGAQWGRIPVWGFGSVVESRHTDVPVGERLYGYFPMSNTVDLTPARVSPISFVDAAPHRAELHPVYNQYTRTATDPFYTADTEDIQALLRPLFITSWLIDDFLADNDFFGATADPHVKGIMLLSSASSKTAYGTAFCLSRRRTEDRARVIGMTSAGNLEFCRSMHCYDEVLDYSTLASLDRRLPTVFVDFAGNAALRRQIHEHFGDALRYSCSVGATHWEERGHGHDLPGPRPALFFAPAQMAKRSGPPPEGWGPGGLDQHIGAAWQAFMVPVNDPHQPWLRVRTGQGAVAVREAMAALLDGKVDPRDGFMLSL